jgi:hypothetical protein
MPEIFISYRRADSQAIADRMYEHLSRVFGDRNIFKDVDDIPLGADFRKTLQERVLACDVLLVVIGREWAAARYDDGRRRIDDPNDFVRIEVEAGLQRDDVLVIPVMVNNAPMPAPDSLPDSLRDLAYRNAIQVRNDPDFRNDIARLSARLQDYLKSRRPARRAARRVPVAAADSEVPQPVGQRRFSRVRIATGAIALLIVAALAAIAISGQNGNGGANIISETPLGSAEAILDSAATDDSAVEVAVSTPEPEVVLSPTVTIEPLNPAFWGASFVIRGDRALEALIGSQFVGAFNGAGSTGTISYETGDVQTLLVNDLCTQWTTHLIGVQGLPEDINAAESACQDQTFPQELTEFPFAGMTLVIVVSPQNDFLTGLTRTQLEVLYDEPKTWAEVDALEGGSAWPEDRVSAYVPPEQSPAWEVFTALTDGYAGHVTAYDLGSLVSAVASDPYAVAVMSLNDYLIYGSSDLSIVPIEGVNPLDFSQRDDYPLRQTFSFYTSPQVLDDAPDTAAFLNFVLVNIDTLLAGTAFEPPPAPLLDQAREDWNDRILPVMDELDGLQQQ